MLEESSGLLRRPRAKHPAALIRPAALTGGREAITAIRVSPSRRQNASAIRRTGNGASRESTPMRPRVPTTERQRLECAHQRIHLIVQQRRDVETNPRVPGKTIIVHGRKGGTGDCPRCVVQTARPAG